MTRQKQKKNKKPSPKRKSVKPAVGGHIGLPGEILVVNAEGWTARFAHQKRWQIDYPILAQCIPLLVFAGFLTAGLIGYYSHG